jgi:hypothetical protein
MNLPYTLCGIREYALSIPDERQMFTFDEQTEKLLPTMFE